MARPRIVITQTDLNCALSPPRPSTNDDVCVTRDGRRLDTPDKLRSFLDELSKSRQPVDDDLDIN